jgi:hypothetical protein
MCLLDRLRLVNKRLSRLGSISCKLLDLHSKSLSADDLRCVAAAFPAAEEVDLTFCKQLGPNAIAQLQCCSGSLSKLVLRGVGVTDEMLQAVPHFTRLTTLDISQSTPVSNLTVTIDCLIAPVLAHICTSSLQVALTA